MPNDRVQSVIVPSEPGWDRVNNYTRQDDPQLVVEAAADDRCS